MGGSSPKTGRDTLEVYQDGELAEDLIKGWDERIEALLPLGISNLFLFDGEQVAELAEQDELPGGVVQAMRSLLGLELPERLDTDLDVLHSTASANSWPKVTTCKKSRKSKLSSTSWPNKRAEPNKNWPPLTNKKEWAEHELQQAQDKFLAEGGKIPPPKKPSLKPNAPSSKPNWSTSKTKLRELAAGALPLALIQPLLEAAKTRAHNEVRHQQYELAQDLLSEQNQALLEFAKESLGKKQAKQIQEFSGQSPGRAGPARNRYLPGSREQRSAPTRTNPGPYPPQSAAPGQNST